MRFGGAVVIVLIAVALCVAGSEQQKRVKYSSRIINGSPASPQIVWQVGFQATSGQVVTLCGGSLVSSSTGVPQYVITAGHCVKDISTGTVKNPSSITITPGQSLTSGPTYFVERYWVNPAYDKSYSDTNQVDIAIIKLTVPVTSSDGTPIALCTSINQCEIANAQYIVSGYGDTQCSGSSCSTTSNSLLQVGLQYVAYTTCGQVWQANFNWQLPITSVCAAPPNNGAGGTCFGDSGGPLVYNPGSGFILVGAVSTSTQPQGAPGQACGAPGEIGVFVSIARNIQWIQSVLSGNTTTPSVDAACVSSNTCQTSPPGNGGGGGVVCTGFCVPWYYYVPAIIAGVMLLLLLLFCCIRACSAGSSTRHAVARRNVVVAAPPPKPVTTTSTTTYTVQMQPMAPAPPPPVYQPPVYQPNPYQQQMYTPQYGAGQPPPPPPAAYGGPAPTAPPQAYNPYGRM